MYRSKQSWDQCTKQCLAHRRVSINTGFGQPQLSRWPPEGNASQSAQRHRWPHPLIPFPEGRRLCFSVSTPYCYSLDVSNSSLPWAPTVRPGLHSSQTTVVFNIPSLQRQVFTTLMPPCSKHWLCARLHAKLFTHSISLIVTAVSCDTFTYSAHLADRIWRLKEVKQFAQDYTARKQWIPASKIGLRVHSLCS